MITADEARAISNSNGEDSRIIKTLCDKIQIEALKGYYFIEQDFLKASGNNIFICSFFQRLGYTIKIEDLQGSDMYIPLKRIRISWR